VAGVLSQIRRKVVMKPEEAIKLLKEASGDEVKLTLAVVELAIAPTLKKCSHFSAMRICRSSPTLVYT